MRRKCDTLFIVTLSWSQQHLLECLKQDQDRYTEAGSTGPTNSAQTLGPERPYVFRIPRACSNSCRLCCTCRENRNTSSRNQRLAANTADPALGHFPCVPQAQHQPWSRSIGIRPPGPKAGSRTQHGVPLLGYPPHQSLSEGGEDNRVPAFKSALS